MNDALKRIEQLNTLIELSSLINATFDTQEIKEHALEAAVRLLDAEAGSLILIDRESGDMFFEVALGDKGYMVKEFKLKKGEGIAGWVIEKGEPVIIQDVQSSERFSRIIDEKTKFTTRNMLCVPLKARDRVFGVIEAINKREGSFSGEDQEIFLCLANQVAIAIENANLYHDLKETFYSTAQALAETIEKRDHYTGGHTKRVMNYSYAIGKVMGLSKKELEDLKLAAILHDVGKIGVGDHILLKNGNLDPEEAERMNMHTKYGAEILSHIKYLKDIIPGVLSHHERIDGKGYPDSLKGGDIPVIARIISVADTFDALTSDRPYRKAIGHDTAVEELKANAGKQFDKEVVDTFVGLYEGTDFKKIADREWKSGNGMV